MNTDCTKILLVEDNPADADLLIEILTETNDKIWQISQTDRLEIAFEYLLKEQFHIVLLDLSLPDSQGLDTLMKLQENIINIPIVILTGLDDKEMGLKALEKGAQDYIIKGRITNELLEKSIFYAIKRKEIDVKIRLNLQKEQEINNLKSTFISMVSHEFRNPLTVIRSASYLLKYKGEKLNEEHKNKFFNLIENAIDTQLKLLDEILLIGSYDAGKIRYNPSTLNLEIFFLSLIEVLKTTDNNKHNITLTLGGNFDQVTMDQTLLQHIFTNLLTNAIKYSPEGGDIKIDLTRDNEYIICTIEDEGIGISLEEQKHLFETFYRGSNVRKIEGTGLGLSIVKNCVDLHQGQINVSSENGKGSMFKVLLPG